MAIDLEKIHRAITDQWNAEADARFGMPLAQIGMAAPGFSKKLLEVAGLVGTPEIPMSGDPGAALQEFYPVTIRKEMIGT